MIIIERMQYFFPILALSMNLPPQTQTEDKVGGLPWGLPIEKYPVCCDCGRSQSLLVQLMHHPQRLDLERAGRALFVFHCNYDSDCATWEGGHCANACFVLEPEELTTQLTPLPSDNPPLEVEVRIVGWKADDDGMPEDRVTPNGQIIGFEENHNERMNFYEEHLVEKDFLGLKLGGCPLWIQDPREAPQPGWKFAAQLDITGLVLDEEPIEPPKDEFIYQLDDGRWHCQWPNLGSATGYVFIRPQAERMQGWFFYQC